MLVGILMGVIFRRLGWQGMYIEFGGEAFGQQLFRRQRRKYEVPKMDHIERANIGKILYVYNIS